MRAWWVCAKTHLIPQIDICARREQSLQALKQFLSHSKVDGRISHLHGTTGKRVERQRTPQPAANKAQRKTRLGLEVWRRAATQQELQSIDLIVLGCKHNRREVPGLHACAALSCLMAQAVMQDILPGSVGQWDKNFLHAFLLKSPRDSSAHARH